jgi:SAM-dependent methyltransferase
VEPTLQHRVLEALEGARNYNSWVASLCLPYLGDDPVEVGSGTGTYAELWLDSGLRRLTVSDTDPALVDRLRRRFEGDDRVTVRSLDLLEATPSEHTAVVAVNVLEHILADVAALRAAASLVRTRGLVVVFVPAFAFAMSRFDRAIGHHRRYTASTIRGALTRAGLTAEEIRYVNAPGLLAWIVGMRLLRLSPQEGPILRLWDSGVIPVTRKLEDRWHAPFGQSLLAIGRSGT